MYIYVYKTRTGVWKFCRKYCLCFRKSKLKRSFTFLKSLLLILLQQYKQGLLSADFKKNNPIPKIKEARERYKTSNFVACSSSSYI